MIIGCGADTLQKGPVLLDFPIDVLFSPIQPKLIAWGSIASPFLFRPGPSEGALKAAVELLASAKRPVIITGTGAKHPHVSWTLGSLQRSLMTCADTRGH